MEDEMSKIKKMRFPNDQMTLTLVTLQVKKENGVKVFLLV
jgi:hypothetical protein